MSRAYTDKEKAFLIPPIIFALIVPIALGFLKPIAVYWIFNAVISSAAIISIFAVGRIGYDWKMKGFNFFEAIFRNLRPLPPAMVCGTDLKRDVTPVVTLFLIMVNVLMYVAVTDAIEKSAVFPPVGTTGWDHWVASLFTSAFLHGSLPHLFGNMVFLWVIGSALESRLGPVRFLKCYFACLLFSKLMVISMLWLQEASFGKPQEFHCLGASGAIAGLMGLFVVRCFFAQLHVTLPFILSPMFSIQVKIPCMVLLGLFFARDICGSQLQFYGFPIMINYWAHVGGYLAGFFLGYYLGLNQTAAREALEIKAGRMAIGKTERGAAFRIYKGILARDPHHEATLEYFLGLYHHVNGLKAGAFFDRLMQLYECDMPKAAKLFRDYYPCYVDRLPAHLLTRLGNHFFRNCDLEKARICFHLAAAKKGPWQPRAMLYLGRTFAGLGDQRNARESFAKVATCFPGTVFQQEALKRGI